MTQGRRLLLSPLLLGLASSWAPLRGHNSVARHAAAAAVSRSTTRLNMSTDASIGALTPSETALVFIEFQNEFTTPGGKLHEAVKACMDKTDMLSNASRLLVAARAAGCTIVHCPINFEPGHNEIADSPYGILAGVKEGATFTNGEWGAEFCDAMKPQPGDLVVKGKSGLDGFYSTNLDFLLRQKKAKNVVLGGFLTNCCVESTMRTAYEHGYQVYTLQDCVATTSVEAQEATLEYNFGMFSQPTTSDAVIEAVKAATPITN